VSLDPTAITGLGFYVDKHIIMPTWLDDYDPIYKVYYVLHEMVHCMTGEKHDEIFKRVEDVILALWDIKIIRKKVYPKVIYWREQEVENIPGRRSKNDGKN
jgi:hypothetical protein